MNRYDFFKESIKNIKTAGTITKSSKFLCERMVSHIDFEQAEVIVELGAGDGAITKHLLKNMKPTTQLLSFEVNEKLSSSLEKIDDKRFHLITDSAENLPLYLNKLGFEQIDYIISALPFVIFPKELTNSILEKSYQYLS